MKHVVPAFRRNFAIAAVVLGLTAQIQAQGSLSVKDVMRRVESYAASYGEKASIVVCTERYTQTSRGAASTVDDTRRLVSDFAIVQADTIHGWLGFRDVLEVDGKTISDREGRLLRVLMASEGRYDEARQLSDESARYNIGTIQRNFNVPTTTLFFFVPENRSRFKFSARTVAADGTWEIAFSERDTPSLIRTPEGRSIPSSGTIYVQPQDGVVVRSVLRIDSRRTPRGSGTVDVTYHYVETLGMWLPASMDESFEASTFGGGWSRVTGHAEYSNYRTFTTSVRIK